MKNKILTIALMSLILISFASAQNYVTQQDFDNWAKEFRDNAQETYLSQQDFVIFRKIFYSELYVKIILVLIASWLLVWFSYWFATNRKLIKEYKKKRPTNYIDKEDRLQQMAFQILKERNKLENKEDVD